MTRPVAGANGTAGPRDGPAEFRACPERTGHLVAEADRADDEFEAFLLRLLSECTVTIPELGTLRAQSPPVLSDGWERADPALPAVRLRRLYRPAHRVVWADPRKAQPGHAPLAAGTAAALPHMDAFVEGHGPGAMEHPAAVVRGVVRDA